MYSDFKVISLLILSVLFIQSPNYFYPFLLTDFYWRYPLACQPIQRASNLFHDGEYEI